VTPTIDEQLARLVAEVDAFRARVGRLDARLWQLERRGADLHGLRERLRAAADAVGRLRIAVRAA
jgi:hypothetical protein